MKKKKLCSSCLGALIQAYVDKYLKGDNSITKIENVKS